MVRGLVSLARAAGLALPRLPIAGAGYLLPAVGDRAVFGATSQSGDDDASVRDADHAHNLAQLASLVGNVPALAPHDLSGRVGWRWVSDDRLPLIGAVPDVAGLAAASRLDQPRLVPRLAGLWMFTALGSRGITWSALGAQLLASWVTGGPSPVEASLLDALDPARFISRDARRAAASG
jgi:tRNA 5-methylaminomethyl-2-thiouridine biosynthesis bifunctional protein